MTRSAQDEWPSVRVRPHRRGAAEFSWYDGGQWLIFQVGAHCRWELDKDDAAPVRRLADAVIAGHGHEITGPGGRHRVVLTLDDGSQKTQTTYDGCLPAVVPLPGRTLRSPRHHFAPYAGTAG